eukprot:SAG31_NODE_2478_length_5637_cov_2.220657_1_plen_123_part_00
MYPWTSRNSRWLGSSAGNNGGVLITAVSRNVAKLLLCFSRGFNNKRARGALHHHGARRARPSVDSSGTRAAFRIHASMADRRAYVWLLHAAGTWMWRVDLQVTMFKMLALGLGCLPLRAAGA